MDRDMGLSCGQKLYFELVDHGYMTIELPSQVMRQYLIHFAHGTQVFNPREFTVRKRTKRKCVRLVDKVMSSNIIQVILTDGSLDK